MSGKTRRDVSSSGNKLQPSFLKDSIGLHILVTCGNVSGKLYLCKLDESKKPLPKCILVNSVWYSPPEVESLAGKKSKKWKQSLRHLDKPLFDYILSGSHVSTCQQGPSSVVQIGSSSDISNITVVDNIRASGCVSRAVVSDSESVSDSVSPAGLPESLLVPSEVSLPSSPTTTPSISFAQPVQFSPTTNASVPTLTGPKPMLVDTVLSFIVAFRLKGDNDSLKKIVVERFCNDDVETAKKLLWDCCSSDLLAKGLPFHTRRDSERRSQLEAHLKDILDAFDVLDSSDSIPTICCEATSLLRIPPLSLDPVAEQVHSNSQTLEALFCVINGLEKKLSDFILSTNHSAFSSSQQGLVTLRLFSPPLLLRCQNLHLWLLVRTLCLIPLL